ncbi:MAG: hypothetical protein PVH19_00705 [Planctomycetia bacterium]|jgi:hypothetical protein
MCNFKRQSIWILLAVVGSVMLCAPSILSAAPPEKPPAKNRIVIPKEGVKPWERKFLESLQEIQSVDFQETDAAEVLPHAKKFVEKLFDIKNYDQSIAIEYEMKPTIGDRPFVERVTIRFAHRVTLRIAFSVKSPQWQSVELVGHRTEKDGFMSPLEVPDNPGTTYAAPGAHTVSSMKAAFCSFHSHGQLAKIEYGHRGVYECLQLSYGTRIEWDESGNMCAVE